MRHLAWLVSCMVFLSVASVAAPLYRAGEGSSRVSSLLHGEISADYPFSSLQLSDYMEEYKSSSLHGLSGRILWSPLAWLAVGAERTWFSAEDLPEALVDSYRVTRTGGVLKLTLAPDTLPCLYVVAGYGRTKHNVRFMPIAGFKWATVQKSVPYWMAGLGLETDIWKGIFAGVEGNIFWHKEKTLGRFHKTASQSEMTLRLRAGVRF